MFPMGMMGPGMPGMMHPGMSHPGMMGPPGPFPMPGQVRHSTWFCQGLKLWRSTNIIIWSNHWWVQGHSSIVHCCSEHGGPRYGGAGLETAAVGARP